jgi:hypothetical protein
MNLRQPIDLRNERKSKDDTSYISLWLLFIFYSGGGVLPGSNETRWRLAAGSLKRGRLPVRARVSRPAAGTKRTSSGGPSAASLKDSPLISPLLANSRLLSGRQSWKSLRTVMHFIAEWTEKIRTLFTIKWENCRCFCFKSRTVKTHHKKRLQE